MKKIQIFRWLMIASLASLSGCNNDMSDLQRHVEKIKARPGGAIEPIPVVKPYVRFIYPGHDKDPFDTTSLYGKAEQVQVEGSVSIDLNRVPEFLESYSLDSLRMVGTVNKDNHLWALIRIPSGAVHRVKKGNYIGKNHGRITDIKDIKLSLTEVVTNGHGGYKERETNIELTIPEKTL